MNTLLLLSLVLCSLASARRNRSGPTCNDKRRRQRERFNDCISALDDLQELIGECTTCRGNQRCVLEGRTFDICEDHPARPSKCSDQLRFFRQHTRQCRRDLASLSRSLSCTCPRVRDCVFSIVPNFSATGCHCETDDHCPADRPQCVRLATDSGVPFCRRGDTGDRCRVDEDCANNICNTVGIDPSSEDGQCQVCATDADCLANNDGDDFCVVFTDSFPICNSGQPSFSCVENCDCVSNNCDYTGREEFTFGFSA